MRGSPCNFLCGMVFIKSAMPGKSSAICRLIRELISPSHPGSQGWRLIGVHSAPGLAGLSTSQWGWPLMCLGYCLVIKYCSDQPFSLKLDKINKEVSCSTSLIKYSKYTQTATTWRHLCAQSTETHTGYSILVELYLKILLGHQNYAKVELLGQTARHQWELWRSCPLSFNWKFGWFIDLGAKLS